MNFSHHHRDLARLRDEITLLAGHLNYRFLTLIAEFDRRNGWADNATQSYAHWLNWKCGIAMGAAREKLRVARALENLPKLAAAMERGEISYSEVSRDHARRMREHGDVSARHRDPRDG